MILYVHLSLTGSLSLIFFFFFFFFTFTFFSRPQFCFFCLTPQERLSEFSVLKIIVVVFATTLRILKPAWRWVRILSWGIYVLGEGIFRYDNAIILSKSSTLSGIFSFCLLRWNFCLCWHQNLPINQVLREILLISSCSFRKLFTLFIFFFLAYLDEISSWMKIL